MLDETKAELISEIKIRAWNIDKKKMHFPEDDDWNITIRNGKIIAFEIPKEENAEAGRLIPLMNIGLCDKNQKDVYDGDIYKTADDEIGLVSFCSDSGHGCWKVSKPFGKGAWVEIGFLYWDRGEIIGNIWENENLLEL